MKIYRHKDTGVLYNLYRVTPRMVMGEFLEAVPYNREGKALNSQRQLNKLVEVAYR